MADDIHLNTYDFLKKIKKPNFWPDLSKLNFDSYIYFINHRKTNKKWNEVSKDIKNIF